MALMKSPCRPEKDGYFGSTYGHYPYSIEYGFQIETLPNSKLTEVITAIDDYIVDEILTNIYPAMCGYRRRRGRSLIESGTATTHSGRPGGFHFGQTLELPHGKYVTLCEWINERGRSCLLKLLTSLIFSVPIDLPVSLSLLVHPYFFRFS